MDRGFEILINMLVGQYGHEWEEIVRDIKDRFWKTDYAKCS